MFMKMPQCVRHACQGVHVTHYQFENNIMRIIYTFDHEKKTNLEKGYCKKMEKSRKF